MSLDIHSYPKNSTRLGSTHHLERNTLVISALFDEIHIDKACLISPAKKFTIYYSSPRKIDSSIKLLIMPNLEKQLLNDKIEFTDCCREVLKIEEIRVLSFARSVLDNDYFNILIKSNEPI